MGLGNSAVDLENEEFIDELKPGTKLMLGQYTIEDFLAAGGFGITYLAKDSLNRRVVIKECFPGSFCRRQNCSVMPRSRAHQNELKSIVRLFSQEAMSLAKANHPNIVGVHQVWEENNTAYMALDYVQGRDLLEILKEDPDSLKPALVEGYLGKVLDAIGHIHKLGILHRDISPDNIIINELGEPILIDFGAARESTNANVTRMLSALRVVKDGYSPQEFYIAGSDQSPSCDLYSLAASFYHVITRELPPDSQWRLSACAAGDEDPYVSLGEKTGDFSKRFVTGLDKAMAILPRDRMQSAEEWLSHMTNGAEPVASVTPVKPVRPVAAPKNEKKSMLPILLSGTALAAAAGVGFMYFSSSETAVSDVTSETAVAAVEAPAAPVAPEIEPVTEDVATAAPVVDSIPAEVEEPVIAEVWDFATKIAEPPIPTLGEESAVPPTIIAVPEQIGIPREIALADINTSQPILDTTAPAAIPPVPVANAPTESAQTPEIGPEFFMAMAKESGQSVAPPTARPAPVAAPRSETAGQDSSPVITRDLPAVPFTLSSTSPGMIARVNGNAPTWMTVNSSIVSVNGKSVETNEQIDAALAELAAQTDASSFDVILGIHARLNGAAFERNVTIAKEKHTLLLNGMHFVSRKNNTAWTTEVVEAPSSSNFQAGDRLVSYVATWEELDGPDTLPNILERELEKGTSSFNFAVSRNGEIWVEVFNLASLGN